MKNFKTSLFAFVLLAVLVFTPAAFAQTTVVQTTLAAAITDTGATTIQVASSASITASTASLQQYCLIDQEVFFVRAIPVSGFLTVRRGESSTVGALHVVQSVVTCGPAGSWDPRSGQSTGVFVRTIPIAGSVCVVANQGYTFVVQALNNASPSFGTYARCNASSLKWETASTQATTNKKPSVAITASTYTATLFDYHLHSGVGGTGNITITLPSVTNDFGTELTVSEFTTLTPPTITITGANGQFIGNALTTTITVNGTGLRLISVGGAWRTIE